MHCWGITAIFFYIVFYSQRFKISWTNCFCYWLKIVGSQWLQMLFPPLRCSALPLLHPPSVGACLWVPLPSVLHSAGCDRVTDLAIDEYCISLLWDTLALLLQFALALWSAAGSVFQHLAEFEQRAKSRAPQNSSCCFCQWSHHHWTLVAQFHWQPFISSITVWQMIWDAFLNCFSPSPYCFLLKFILVSAFQRLFKCFLHNFVIMHFRHARPQKTTTFQCLKKATMSKNYCNS